MDLIDNKKTFEELPANAPIGEPSGPDGGWTYAKFSHMDWRIVHHYYKDGNLHTDSYPLPETLAKVIHNERKHARDDLRRDLSILLGIGFGNKPEIRVRLAKALHRRHMIDDVEHRQMCNSRFPESRDFARVEPVLTEEVIETSWSADGSTRAYWVLLAGEALRILQMEDPTPLPTPKAETP